MKLLQIVPRLPPPDEGVGGTAVALAERLAEAHGISTRFVVPSAFRPPSPSFDEREFPIDAVEPTGSALAEILTREAPAGPVLLHYANYGYEARGCPHWLVEGLRTWRAKAPTAPWTTLRTMFHEVYASGPIWRSSFWLGRTQKRLAAETARLSTSLATGLEKYAALIRALPQVGDLGAIPPIDIRPIFSGVGEPASVSNWSYRPRRLVVFGGSGVRSRSYGPFADELATACRALGIVEILDIGPGEVSPLKIEGVPVERLGPLPAGEVSNLLLASAAGFLGYPTDFLPKSSAFAAYSAHALPTVVAGGPARPAEGLAPEETYLAADHLQTLVDAGTLEATAARVASAARSWYEGHSLARQAEEIARWMASRA